MFADEPLEFRGGEIGVDLQSGARVDGLCTRSRHLGRAEGVSATVLPDERGVQRLARAAREHDDGLALIRDAEESGRETGGDGALRHGAQDGQRVPPDFGGVVLDPTGLRIELFVRPGLPIEHATAFIEQQRFGRRGALIERENRAHGTVSYGSRARAASARPSIEMP